MLQFQGESREAFGQAGVHDVGRFPHGPADEKVAKPQAQTLKKVAAARGDFMKQAGQKVKQYGAASDAALDQLKD